ncbi:MAG: HigA family addiction module antitoxin [Gemmatimonadales bacterium]|jgi:addiction module HigA family antidote
MAATKLAPIHPGEILLEEFLEPLGISQYRLAKDISVPPRRINEIVHGIRAISADTALGASKLGAPRPLFERPILRFRVMSTQPCGITLAGCVRY